MGSLEEELGRAKGEELLLVTITKPFYICKDDFPMFCRSANRDGSLSDNCEKFIGFRLAIVPIN